MRDAVIFPLPAQNRAHAAMTRWLLIAPLLVFAGHLLDLAFTGRAVVAIAVAAVTTRELIVGGGSNWLGVFLLLDIDSRLTTGFHHSLDCLHVSDLLQSGFLFQSHA